MRVLFLIPGTIFDTWIVHSSITLNMCDWDGVVGLALKR